MSEAISSDGLPWSEVEFVGGPCDGTNTVHPLMNSVLTVDGGTYTFWGDKYWWEAGK